MADTRAPTLTSAERDLIARMRGFEADHAPDGWPAIRMRDVSALVDVVERLAGQHGSNPLPVLDGGQLWLMERQDGALRVFGGTGPVPLPSAWQGAIDVAARDAAGGSPGC